MVEYKHGRGFSWGIDISNGQLKNVNGISFNPGNIDYGDNVTTFEGSYAGTKLKQLTVNIDALTELNMASVVQNPRVSVRSGNQATLTLREDRYVEQSQSGITGTSFQLSPISAPITLTVTPTTANNNTIDLTIDATLQEFVEMDDGYDDGQLAFIVESNEVNTDVNIKNGETYIIGGLIKEDKTKVRNGIPILKDIPLLGLLFSKVQDAIMYTELVIYITVTEGLNTDPNILGNDENLKYNDENFERWIQENKRSRKDLRKKRRAIKKEFRVSN